MARQRGRGFPRPFFLEAHWSTTVLLVVSTLLGVGSLIALVLPQAARGPFDNRTLVSVCALAFAVLSFILRSVQTELQSRKQHTIKVLFDTRLSSEFRDMLELRREHFPIQQVIDPRRYRSFLDARRDAQLTEDEARSRRRSAEALRSLLNYYEFVAFAVVMRDLDKTLLKGTIRSIMCNLVQDARYVIADSQRESPTHYEHLADLYGEWRENRFEAIPAPGTLIETAASTDATTSPTT